MDTKLLTLSITLALTSVTNPQKQEVDYRLTCTLDKGDLLVYRNALNNIQTSLKNVLNIELYGKSVETYSYYD